MTNTTKAHLGLLFTAFIYGSSFIIAKEIMGDGYIKPFGLILLRVSFAYLLFRIVNPLFIKEKIEKKDYKHLFVGGIFGVALNMLCFFKGLDLTTPIHGSLIMTTTPILVMIIAVILRQEHITVKKTIGVILGAIGAILLVSQAQEHIGYASNTALGDILILINAISYAFYLVIIKKMTKKYHPITVIKWVFFFGLIIVFPFGIQEVIEVDWTRFTFKLWMALGFILLFTSFFSYFFNIFGLKYVKASSVSSYIYLQPFIATTIAILLNKEALSSLKIVSGILIFIGVFLILNKQAKAKL